VLCVDVEAQGRLEHADRPSCHWVFEPEPFKLHGDTGLAKDRLQLHVAQSHHSDQIIGAWIFLEALEQQMHLLELVVNAGSVR
jgi:hypothetical protein